MKGLSYDFRKRDSGNLSKQHKSDSEFFRESYPDIGWKSAAGWPAFPCDLVQVGNLSFLFHEKSDFFKKDIEKTGSGFVFDGRLGCKRILAQQHDVGWIKDNKCL